MSNAPNRLTPEQYLEMERTATFRSEYYDGQVFAMSGGSRAHARLAGRLTLLAGSHIERRGYEFYGSDMRVLVEAKALYTYPDFAVACGPRFADGQVDTLVDPVLLVEVLSPSTEQYDRGFKVPAYRSIPSLREILLISQDTAQIECYRTEDSVKWTLMTVSGLDATIDLVSIGFTLRLADLYSGILPETADSTTP